MLHEYFLLAIEREMGNEALPKVQSHAERSPQRPRASGLALMLHRPHCVGDQRECLTVMPGLPIYVLHERVEFRLIEAFEMLRLRAASEDPGCRCHG